MTTSVRAPERLSRNCAQDAMKGATRSMATKFPEQPDTESAPGIGSPREVVPQADEHRARQRKRERPGDDGRDIARRRETQRRRRDCAATAPPTTVTTTSMSANPSASASDDPTSGSNDHRAEKGAREHGHPVGTSAAKQQAQAQAAGEPDAPRVLVRIREEGRERAEREVRHGDYDDGLYLAQDMPPFTVGDKDPHALLLWAPTAAKRATVVPCGIIVAMIPGASARESVGYAVSAQPRYW